MKTELVPKLSNAQAILLGHTPQNGVQFLHNVAMKYSPRHLTVIGQLEYDQYNEYNVTITQLLIKEKELYRDFLLKKKKKEKRILLSAKTETYIQSISFVNEEKTDLF